MSDKGRSEAEGSRTKEARPRRAGKTAAKRKHRPEPSVPVAAEVRAEPEMSSVERRARRALFGGALLLMAGLAVVGIGDSDAGAGMTLVALVVVIYGIHTFGRLGPDDPTPAEAPAQAHNG